MRTLTCSKVSILMRSVTLCVFFPQHWKTWEQRQDLIKCNTNTLIKSSNLSLSLSDFYIIIIYEKNYPNFCSFLDVNLLSELLFF